MEWWIWLVAGFALLVLELFAPSGFYLFIFGTAALLMGLLNLSGVDLSTNLELVIYAIFSILLLVAVRKHLVAKLYTGSRDVSDELTGQEVVVKERIVAHGIGTCELRGSSWKARNLSEHTLNAGERALVRSVDGLTLALEKKE